MSFISIDSQAFLRQFWRMQSVRKVVGAVSGPSADPGEWSARLIDALVTIQEERDRADEIRQRVTRKE